MSFKQVTEDYIRVPTEEYKELIRLSEQLRIIKNFSKLKTTTMLDMQHLVEALEQAEQLTVIKHPTELLEEV